jgi:hypothetical protein
MITFDNEFDGITQRGYSLNGDGFAADQAHFQQAAAEMRVTPDPHDRCLLAGDEAA